MIQTILLGLLVFSLTLIDDVFAALYVNYIGKDNRTKAAIFSTLIEMSGLAFLYILIEDFWALLFGIPAAYLGTKYYKEIESFSNKFLSTRFNKKNSISQMGPEIHNLNNRININENTLKNVS